MAACGTVQRLQQGCMALPHQQLHMMSTMASVGFPHAPIRLQSFGGSRRREFSLAPRSQAAATESAAAVAESPKLVEAPVSIVTGASRGIGKAIALALGGAGGKVKLVRQGFSRVFRLPNSIMSLFFGLDCWEPLVQSLHYLIWIGDTGAGKLRSIS
jgi:hypothetical protein